MIQTPRSSVLLLPIRTLSWFVLGTLPFAIAAQAGEISDGAAENSAATDAAPSSTELEAVNVTASRGKSLNLDQPSTAGSRLNLTPLETPASVVIISGDSVRAWGDETLVDAETRAPGITASPIPGNGNGALAARGFFGTTSVMQLYDGMQLYNAGGVTTFPYDPWNVDQIEVLYGPASVLYGTGAIGGAVNVVPRRPDPSRSNTQVQLSAGSWNTFHEALDSTGPIGQNTSYRFDISQRNSDGWADRADSRSVAISAALRYDVNPEFHLTLSDDYGNQHPSTYEGTPIVNGALVPGLLGKNFNVYDANVNFVDNWTRLAAEWTPSDSLSLRNDTYVMAHFREYRESYQMAWQPATKTVRRYGYRDIHAHESQYGDHGYLTYKGELAGLKNEVVTGFDLNHAVYSRNDNTNAAGSYTGNSVINPFDFDPGFYADGGAIGILNKYRTVMDQWGVFAEDRLSINERLSLVAGVRRDRYELTREDRVLVGTVTDSTYDTTGWHVGAVYNPVPNLSLYAQYAVASDPVSALPSIGISQQQFKLTTGKQVEAGIKQSLWDDRLQWTFAAYRIVKNNLVTTTLDNPTLSEQVGQQSSRGAEASVAFHLDDAWAIEANGTVLDAKFDSYYATLNGKLVSLAGYRPYMVPNRSANLRLTWDFLPGWQARSAVRYVGNRFADNTDLSELPTYTVVDFGVRWIAASKLKLDLRLSNAFDRIYAQSTSTGTATQWIVGDRRAVVGTVDYQF